MPQHLPLPVVVRRFFNDIGAISSLLDSALASPVVFEVSGAKVKP